MTNYVKRFLLTALLALLPALPAGAYPCFYEPAAPVQRGTGQNLLVGAVDTATGAFVKVFNCQTIPGPTPLKGWLYYNTQDASKGPFGIGTSCAYDYFIRANPPYPGAAYELIAPGNLHYAFDANSGGTYSDTHDPELLGATLSFTNQPTGVTSTLTWKGGVRFQFDAFGGLIHIVDVPGNTTNITRNTINGFVAQVSSPTNTNRMVQYRQDVGNNHVTQILAQYSYLGNVRRWNIAYDAATPTGKMTSVTDPLSHVYAFTWTSYTRSDGQVLPLLATGTDGRGMRCLSLHYDASGRVSSMDNAIGGALTFTYSGAIGSAGTSTCVDPAGHSTTATFAWNPNRYGYLISQIRDNTLNETTTIAHAAPPTYLPTAVTDYRGRVQGNTWNTANGDMLTATSPTAAGGTATTTYVYDSVFHRRSQMTNPAGQVSRWSVNPTTSNVDSYTNPAGEVTTYGYNPVGQLISSTDPLGHTVHWNYDTYGMSTSVTQPAGGTATLVRDDLGEITQVTDEVSNSTFYTYDLLGHLASVSVYPYPGAPANAILTNNYTSDAVGNTLTATDPAGHGWSWTYDCANNVLTETNPLSQTRRWTWTPTSKLASYTDFAGNTVSGAYLTDGRMASATFKNPSGGTESTITYGYDPTTHLLTTTSDSLAGTYSVTTDLLERVTNVTTPNGNVGYAYDVLGRPTSMTPTGQNPVTYTYHPRGSVATITQDGAVTALTCNALGQVVTKTLSNGVTTTLNYDANGRVSVVASAKNGVAFDQNNYTYDPAGRLVQMNATSGSSHTITYNNYNQVTSVSNQNDPTKSVSWTYNPSGTRATQIVNGATTTYNYNNANQLTAVNGSALTLNGNGNPTAYSGRTYNWNARNQLTGYVAGGTAATYTYAPTGAPASSVVNSVPTTNLYGLGGLVRQVVNGAATNYLHGPGGAIRAGASYVSTNGNRSTTALTNSAGTVVGAYGYDAFGLATHTGTAATPVQFAGGISDTPTVVTLGKTPYSPEWGQPLTQVGMAPHGPGVPGHSPSTVLPSFQYVAREGDEEFEYGGGAGGGGGSITPTGAPNYAPGCGPPRSETAPTVTPYGVAGPDFGTLNGQVPIKISLGVNTPAGGGMLSPRGCRGGEMTLTQFANATGAKMYPFENIPYEGTPQGKITNAIQTADIIEFNLDRYDVSQGFSKTWNFEPNHWTDTEFSLCHSAQTSAVVRWNRCGVPQFPPAFTYNLPVGGEAQVTPNENTITFITGPVGPYGGPGGGTAP
jgi:YD repeat-containing protein